MDRLSNLTPEIKKQLSADAAEWLLKRGRSLRFQDDLAEFAGETLIKRVRDSDYEVIEIPHYGKLSEEKPNG